MRVAFDRRDETVAALAVKYSVTLVDAPVCSSRVLLSETTDEGTAIVSVVESSIGNEVEEDGSELVSNSEVSLGAVLIAVTKQVRTMCCLDGLVVR